MRYIFPAPTSMESRMSESFDLVLHGGVCATPSGLVVADIVRDGRIAKIGDCDPAAAAEAVDCTNLHILPGIIDSQVHFREPGAEHKEDLATGGDAAVLGGVTTVFEMPNTNPPTTTPDAIRDKLARAEGRMRCDHAFYIGATGENEEDLAAADDLVGCAGTKIFMGSSTGSLLVEEPERLDRALRAGRRRVAVHCENEQRLRERKEIADAEGHPRAHCVWRDAETAVSATAQLLDRARAARRRVHVLHVTTAEEAALLADSKDISTMEVTPQHLTLHAPEAYERLGTYAQMNPPIRETRHVEGLWRAVRNGVVDVMGSDHAPHTVEEKAKTYPASPSGMPGVQTMLPLMLNHVAEERLTLLRLVDLLCHGPQRIFGIVGKGRITVGHDADLTLVDLKARREIRAADMASRCGWTPYDGMTTTGWPVATIVRGGFAMRDHALVGEPFGEPIRFVEALTP